MAAPIKLSELAVGASGVIREFPKADPASIRLREMGLLIGTRVTLVRTAPLGDPLEIKLRGYLVRTAPLGDPLEIKLRGYHLSLRKSDADYVLVEPAE